MEGTRGMGRDGSVSWVSAMTSLGNPAKTGPMSGSPTHWRPKQLELLKSLYATSHLILMDTP